jgi:hypothetical protein
MSDGRGAVAEKPMIDDVRLDRMTPKKDYSIFSGDKSWEERGICFGKIWTVALVSTGGIFYMKGFEKGVTTHTIDGDFDLGGKLSNITIRPIGEVRLKSDYEIEPDGTKTEGEMTTKWHIFDSKLGGKLDIQVFNKAGKLAQTFEGYFNPERRFGNNIRIWSSGETELQFPEMLTGSLVDTELNGFLEKLSKDIRGVLENKQAKTELERLGAAEVRDASEIRKELLQPLS